MVVKKRTHSDLHGPRPGFRQGWRESTRIDDDVIHLPTQNKQTKLRQEIGILRWLRKIWIVEIISTIQFIGTRDKNLSSDIGKINYSLKLVNWEFIHTMSLSQIYNSGSGILNTLKKICNLYKTYIYFKI